MCIYSCVLFQIPGYIFGERIAFMGEVILMIGLISDFYCFVFSASYLF